MQRGDGAGPPRAGRSGAGRLLLAALALACVAAPAASAALSIATFNVENYTLADRLVDGSYRVAYPKPEREKAALRRVIRALNADILALQEMGPDPFLRELQSDLCREGTVYAHGAVVDAADPDRHVAILSRYPFARLTRHASLPIKVLGREEVVKRGVLEAAFATSGGELALFIVHLKSRRTETREDPASATQREREAEAVRDLILRLFPRPASSRFIVCGDFNDTRGSRPVRSLLRRGQVAIGNLVDAADTRGESWTYRFGREDTYSRIDYFVASAALAPFVAGARIADDPDAAIASDHRPVLLSLGLDAAATSAAPAISGPSR